MNFLAAYWDVSRRLWVPTIFPSGRVGGRGPTCGRLFPSSREVGAAAPRRGREARELPGGTDLWTGSVPGRPEGPGSEQVHLNRQGDVKYQVGPGQPGESSSIRAGRGGKTFSRNTIVTKVPRGLFSASGRRSQLVRVRDGPLGMLCLWSSPVVGHTSGTCDERGGRLWPQGMSEVAGEGGRGEHDHRSGALPREGQLFHRAEAALCQNIEMCTWSKWFSVMLPRSAMPRQSVSPRRTSQICCR